jgi:NAD(P)-dependent dehydrogenase (short-subunit alcohol dehydrogenase family)
MAPTVVLISGANRGIGRVLLERYLLRPNYVVIAANRDPEHASSKNLVNLPKHPESRLIVVKIDAKNETDAANAAKYLEQEGPDHIDLVIANAAVAYRFGKVSEMSVTDIRDHIEPNVYGVVRLYQATLPLLLKSENPKWVTVGSTAGSIEVSDRIHPDDWCSLNTRHLGQRPGS